jgi:hypothetical protein
MLCLTICKQEIRSQRLGHSITYMSKLKTVYRDYLASVLGMVSPLCAVTALVVLLVIVTHDSLLFKIPLV